MHSLETRQKISTARKRYWEDPARHVVLSENMMGNSRASGVSWSILARAQQSTIMTGVPKSDAARCAMRLSALRRVERDGPPRPVWKNTRLEQALVHLLESAGFTVEREKRFGRFRVDAYVPERHLAFEADGPHHELFRQEHDARRDCELTERFQLPVVRLTAQELDPWRQ